MSPILNLPYELISYVIYYLSIDDIRCLSLTTKRFQYLTDEPNITKRVLDTEAKESPEARRARVSQRYALELRRLIKRREALSSVRPFAAAVIAVAESWMYDKGKLLYIYERRLRILDLHNSASTEFVIDVDRLVGSVIAKSKSSQRFRFDLLHAAEDIVSCLYTHAKPDRESRLVVFNAKEKRILTATHLDTAYKIFVRNNDKFLYFGTHSYTGRDGFRRWVLKAYDIRRKTWLEDSLTLDTMVGSEIGSTICFDIFDDYLYGLANSITFEVEETEWTSYYKGFRFPTNSSGFQNIQWARKHNMWRRQHAEGPIDDRWTFLRNFRDEKTGRYKILESRKEWLSGYRSARRTYYMAYFDDFGSSKRAESALETSDQDGDDHERDEDGEEENDSPLLSESGPSGSHAKLGGARFKPQRRDRCMVHPGDDWETSLMFTLNKCFIRSYHPACETFLDLVDDPASGSNSQRIRIRGGTRSIKAQPIPAGHERLSTAPGTCLKDEAVDPFRYHDVLYWPPEQNPEKHDPALAELTTMLNPPSHLGGIRGAWDDRSFVYQTGEGSGECKALVFLSFDASIRLEGIQPYPGKDPLIAMPAGQWMDASHTTFSETATFSPAPTPDSDWPEDQEISKNMTLPTNEPLQRCDDTIAAVQWCTTERAMYQDIARGYHFFYNKKQQI